MQLSFQQKEQLFHELAQLSRGGVPVLGALEVMARNPGHLGRVAKSLREAWQSQASGRKALKDAGFAARDAAIVGAGEESGRLEVAFAELSVYYAQLAAAKKAVVGRLMYPFFLLHFGVLLLAVPGTITGGLGSFIAGVVPPLLGFYIVAGLLAAVFFGIRNSLAENVPAARLWLRTPVLGGFISTWSAWNYALVLALYIRAGGGLLEAFQAAGGACGNAALELATKDALFRVQGGDTLAEAFRPQSDLPPPLMRAIEIGEHAGKLDEETDRAAEQLKGRFFANVGTLADWTPKLFYIVIVLIVGWRVIGFVSSIGDTYQSVLDAGSQ